MTFAVLRLTALLVCVGLATSRIGLVVHELIGHGAATLAVGGTVTDVQLFYFAGGWIRFRATGGELVIAMGGIVVEVVVGAALVSGFARRDQLAGRIARAIGCALIIHASWYLATGTWHGYGDGVQLHRLLGASRWLVAVPAALVTCAAGYAGAKIVLGALAATVPGSRRARVVGTVIAIVLAGAIQLGAAVGEVVVRRDPTYTTAMRPERERVISRELAQSIEAQRRQGQAPTDADRARLRREIADRHQTFPFAYVLGALLVVAIGAGAARSRATPGGTLSPRLVAIAAAVAG
nr:hypothetical protein [Deltaproteobacteria bacterium]